MKTVPKTIRILTFLLLFAAGILCLLEFFSFDGWRAFTSYLNGIKNHQTGRILLGIAGITLVFMPVLMFFYWNRKRLQLSSYSIPLSPEPVTLRLSSIAEYAARIAEEHAQVAAAKAVVRKFGRAVYVQLSLSVYPDEKIPAICETVRKDVRLALESILGLPDVRRIAILIEQTAGNEWV